MDSSRTPEQLIAHYESLVARQEADNTNEALFHETVAAAREAADVGYAPAQYVTALHLLDNKKELPYAFGYCCRAALQGHKDAIVELRCQYRDGGEKVHAMVRAHLTPEQMAELKLTGMPTWVVKLLFTLLSFACALVGLYFVGVCKQYLIGVPLLGVAVWTQSKGYLPKSGS